MSLTHALRWSFASELAAKAIQPVVFIILARLLTPEDFGVMTAALMAIAFSQIFWEAGMNKALIQRQTDIEAAANVAFWINISLGTFVAALLFITAEPIAQHIFQDTRVEVVLKCMTLQVIFGALASVHTALLQRELGFKKLFWVRFVAVSVPNLAAVPLAWTGWGYWALVVGAIVGQAIQTAMLWHMSNWRPISSFDLQTTREMMGFSKWVMATGMFAWVFNWLDTLYIGIYFTIDQVGLFKVSNQIAVTIFAMVFAFAAPVLYSSLSTESDEDKIKNRLIFYFRIVSALSLPLGILIIIHRGLIEDILGERWIGAGLIIALISAKESVNWIVGYYQEAARAMGKPWLETYDALGSGLIHALVLYFAAREGFDAFVVARSIIIGFFGFVLHAAVIALLLGNHMRRFYKLLPRLFLWLIAVCFIFYAQGNKQAYGGAITYVINVVLLSVFLVFIYFAEKECAVPALAKFMKRKL